MHQEYSDKDIKNCKKYVEVPDTNVLFSERAAVILMSCGDSNLFFKRLAAIKW